MGPIDDRTPLSELGCEHDVLLEADNVIEAKRANMLVALLVTEAAVGENRRAHLLWNDLAEAFDQLVFGRVSASRQRRLLNGFP